MLRRARPPRPRVPPPVLRERVLLRGLHERGGRYGHRSLPGLERSGCGGSFERRHAADDSPAVREPQRRPARLRPGRIPLHRDGGRWLGERSDVQRAARRDAAREDPADRRRRQRFFATLLRHSGGQPVCRAGRSARRDLGEGTSEPLEVLVRPRDRGPLHRRRRPGGAGGNRLPGGGHSGGPELRLEDRWRDRSAGEGDRPGAPRAFRRATHPGSCFPSSSTPTPEATAR